MPYYFIFDLVIIAVVALCAFLGFRRGLVLSLCSLVAVIIALLGANFVARTVSPMLADALEPTFATAIEAQLNAGIHDAATAPAASPEPGMTDEANSFPLQDVLNALKGLGFYQSLVDTVNQAVEDGMNTVAANAAAQVAAAVAQSVGFAILFAVSFIIILVLWTLLSRALDLVARFPGLNFLNKSLGAAFGIVKACLIFFLLAWLLRFSGLLIPEEAVEKTILLRFFMNTTPLALLG